MSRRALGHSTLEGGERRDRREPAGRRGRASLDRLRRESGRGLFAAERGAFVADCSGKERGFPTSSREGGERERVG